MILMDYSEIMHRMLHASIALSKPSLDVDDMFVTTDFIKYTKQLIIDEFILVKQTYSKEFGEIVLCFDNSKSTYWRKDFYDAYKNGRDEVKQKSQINYDEVYLALNGLSDIFKQFSPYVCIDILKLEGDDIILVLANKFGTQEPLLIYSSDKDFIQAQRHSENIKQFSPKIKKYITATSKHESMDHWLIEHVCIGDKIDNVPKVIEKTIFTNIFKDWIKENGFEALEPYDFYQKYTKTETSKLMESFDVYKKITRGFKKGEFSNIKDIFKSLQLSSKIIHKNISEFGSLDLWLDSNPMYRAQYEINYILVMEEGIPEKYVKEILEQYKLAETGYDIDKIIKYLKDNKLSSYIDDLSILFGKSDVKEIDADFFNDFI